MNYRDTPTAEVPPAPDDLARERERAAARAALRRRKVRCWAPAPDPTLSIEIAGLLAPLAHWRAPMLAAWTRPARF